MCLDISQVKTSLFVSQLTNNDLELFKRDAMLVTSSWPECVTFKNSTEPFKLNLQNISKSTIEWRVSSCSHPYSNILNRQEHIYVAYILGFSMRFPLLKEIKTKLL